ncbi:hypothetical protein DY000_02058371 [Brassica cretica]|uniref:KEN domain-containing protein n=1 Tax=Brassica cretica TaxID=69181 RepID=A0ABQ7AKX1_BRACR|nr:hypothetical protein DY000_02058371 [Brassica cretica]
MKEILGTTQKDVLEYFSASFPQLLLQTYHVINEHFQTDPAFLDFAEGNAPQVPVSDRCMAEVSQRLSYAKESASRNVSVQSHGDLARKLQEEMEKNRRSSSGSREGSGRRMKEVACPTCTVRLQDPRPLSAWFAKILSLLARIDHPYPLFFGSLTRRKWRRTAGLHLDRYDDFNRFERRIWEADEGGSLSNMYSAIAGLGSNLRIRDH